MALDSPYDFLYNSQFPNPNIGYQPTYNLSGQNYQFGGGLSGSDKGYQFGGGLANNQGYQMSGGGGGGAAKVAGTAANLLGKANPWLMGGTAVLGGIQAIGGLIGAAKLAKEKLPEYTPNAATQQAYSDAAARAKFGYSPEQVSAFNANVGRTLNADYQNAINMSGGSLAQAMVNRNTGQRLNAFNQFAASDAQLQQANMRYRDQTNQPIQQMQNQNTAYGGAIRSGLTNIAGSFNLAQSLNA